ncbi:MAG: tRNA (adenosine(37)-N6)-threonylcarbamoyltransferase complex dimerization subunit type 1 TsaB [Bacteroidetes bacterium]|nr:MAG: tRNA (adenosine(37)-N6)-threonylcarbamoyltransferase complex dimerization subunit type 1 TsaB [Bacteroidota bacterium]
MTHILSIETATKICSIALHSNGKPISFTQFFIDKSHAERIHALILSVLETSKLKFENLSAIAISAGPGSYTGLRIASALAKGLCFSLDIPLISIETLDAMAIGLPLSLFKKCPMLDARRMEVYCRLYDENNNAISPTEAKIIDSESFINELENSKIVFYGDGSLKCKNLISHPNAFFLDDFYPTALQIGKLAFEKFNQNNFEDLAYFEPHYLKEFYFPVSKK